MRTKRKWLELFLLTRSEKNGIVVLVVILLLFIGLKIVVKQKIISDDFVHIEVFDSPVPRSDKIVNVDTITSFDPNTVSVFQLRKFGMPEYVCRNIEKYRMLGGVYRSASDFKKVYGLNDSLYNRLQNYINIDSLRFQDKPIQKKKKTVGEYQALSERGQPTLSDKFPERITSDDSMKNTKAIYINSADTTSFMQIRGIGSVLSKRIVSYRKALGGFYTVEQLVEVYGLKADVLTKTEFTFVLDTVSLKMIDLNFAEIKDLAMHPYISWDEAKDISRKRSKYGFIIDYKQFLYGCIDSQKVEKIMPYLKK